MPRPIVFLFPGQSSRDATMFARLDAVAPGTGSAAQHRAESALGTPVGDLGSRVDTNTMVQCAVLEASLAYLRLAAAADLVPDASAGLSLGEYAHLVAIGALDVPAARDLVRQRGRCYDAGPAGVMAAVHPIEASIADTLAAEVSAAAGDVHAVGVSNYNSPTQCVVAGIGAAVEEFIRRAEEEHFASGQVIEHRIPMHTPRFAPVAAQFRPALARTQWRVPHSDYWPNVDAAPIPSASAEAIVERLVRHVSAPVRWRQTIDAFLVRYGEPVFVEIGPLQILTRMLSRRWIGPARAFALDLLEDASPSAFATRVEEIRAAAA